MLQDNTGYSGSVDITSFMFRKSRHVISTRKPFTLNEVLHFTSVSAGSYSKICDIQLLQNQRLAEHVNFPDTRIIHPLCILVYLATSWTELGFSFVTRYPVLFSSHAFYSLFVTDYITLCTCNAKKHSINN
jgi:hypothetical protein